MTLDSDHGTKATVRARFGPSEWIGLATGVFVIVSTFATVCFVVVERMARVEERVNDVDRRTARIEAVIDSRSRFHLTP